MPWYNVLELLPGGRYDLVVQIKCEDDAHATDAVSAAMFPGAQVWEGKRYVATLPPHGPVVSAGCAGAGDQPR